jgi:hypothetical protein
MSFSASLRLAPLSACVLSIIASDCAKSPSAAPPAVDFVVAAGDSSFWVSSADGRVRVRRAPLTLANLDGKFFEVYVTDDDRSYFDALLVGQRIFRRDLVSGDSVQVYEDRRVAGIARAYATSHPGQHPLGEDEDGSDDPHTVATSDAEIVEVVGPLLSYAHSTDVDIANVEDSHVVHHGVIDLRDGSVATLDKIFGDSSARRIIADGRAAYRVALDSIHVSRSAGGRRAAQVIDAFRFDSTSFSVLDVDGSPNVGFFVPGVDAAGEGIALPLPEVRAPLPGWWQEIAATIPRPSGDSTSEVWHGPHYDVLSRYDTSGDFARLVVRDSSRHEWVVARIPAPARRLYRLDSPAVDTVVRRGLARAFDESTLYSGAARTVRGPGRPHGRPRAMLVLGPARSDHSLASNRLDRRQ